MGEYTFKLGSGQTIHMTYGVLVEGGQIKSKFGFSPDDKAAVCNMYLDDKSPADPVGIQNFSAKVAEAMSIEQGLVAPGTPRVPDIAIPLWAARETSPAVFFTQFCKFVGAFDPDTSLTITLNGTDENSSAQAQLKNSFGAVVGSKDVSADGSSDTEVFDRKNTHPYDKLEFSEGPNGKVTAAQVTLDPNVLAAGMSIGQIFGSALGGALGGNSLVGNLAGGAIGGLIGQKFVQVLATSMTTDLSAISLNDVFAGQGINVANAGIGAISSFLTAELGHALKIDGFDGQLFDTAVSGFTTSLLSQVTDKMARGGLDFAGAVAAMDWSQAVSGAIDAAQINLGNLLGGYLGHEVVPAQTREGAIGGQLFGAIGGFILPGGLGSLIGTIIGTLIFNHFGTQPSPGAVDLLDQAGTLYGHGQYQSSDGGGYGVSDTMAQAADDIVNAYLHAVDGAALDHGKQVALGYIKNPDLLFITGAPGNTNHSFTRADDAVHAAALDVLQNLEVIGGDLLMKRAHQNSPSNIPEAGPAGGGAPGQSQVSGADQLATMAGDLSVAQDYENYLNNREAINALIAANPDSAFTAGWIATFARVNDLRLNQVAPSDFLGGLVGWLDSVNKAGLGAEAANASVKHGSGNSVIVEVKVAGGVEVPGSLSVFADQTNEISDATGKTEQFVFTNGLTPVVFHTLGAAETSGNTGNDVWIGGANVANTFTGTGGNDVLVGGAMNDVIRGGAGWDFIDGGAGNDYLYGEDGNDQAGDRYSYVHSQVSTSDGGDYSIPDPMAAAAVSIINTYLGAVKGAAIDHSKQVQIGYVTDPTFRYIDGWTPTHKYYSFLGPDDAVHRAAIDVLQHTEVRAGPGDAWALARERQLLPELSGSL